MSDIDKIRNALIFDRAEALRIIAEQDDRILDLEHEIDLLRHTIKVLGFEVTARNAALLAIRDEYSSP